MVWEHIVYVSCLKHNYRIIIVSFGSYLSLIQIPYEKNYLSMLNCIILGYPSGRTTAVGLTQPLTEMSTRNISWGVKEAGAKDWKPSTFMCWLSWNLGASTSWNPLGLSRPIQGLLYLLTVYSPFVGSFVFRTQKPGIFPRHSRIHLPW